MEKPSLDTYLGALESEELLTMARQLEELQGHPGWAAYVELLRVQAQKANYQLVEGPPMRGVENYANATGYLKGLTHAGSSIIDKVQRKAASLQAALEREREEVG